MQEDTVEVRDCHGTGTKVGDPIEAEAIHRTIGQKMSSSRKKLYVGSVKPNIGHLEAAAGVASIIKGVLALERGLIPPNLNFTTPNPSIPLDEWNMVVPTKLTAWPAAAVKRMSVSGFGMGGTNAHIVMEGFKQSAAIRNPNGITISTKKISKRLFVFSSHDKAGFRRISQAILAFLDTLGPATSSSGYLANLAHTLAVARSGLSWKTSIVAENTADLREQLSTMVGDDATRSPTKAPRIGFVFTGQGAQWARMGVELLERHVFAESVAKSTQFLREMGANWDPIAELIKEQKESRLGLPQISQPICTVLQIALVEELRSCGIKPSKVVGHSSGEIAAAYTIGALSHRDAIAIAYFRGTASAGLSAKQLDGGMMAVGCSRAEAQKLMKNSKIQATVACVNSPSNVTLSGDVVALEALRIIFDGLGIFARRLKMSFSVKAWLFRADSRLQREVVTQQFPTQSLLGAMMPTLEENERIWRMISIVLEAAQQIKEINKSALAYKLRDISFLAGLVLTEDVATEITVHLRPHLMATSGSTQPVWWEFTVSSCSGPTGKLRNNCRGLLSIIYEETSSPQMLEEESKVEANRIAKYQSTLIELPQTCTKKFFYERFAKSALPYGEVFQGVENCRPGPGKTCYDVKLIDIGETFSKGKLARPFLISPATLDAVLQGWLGSTCYDSADKENNGNFGFGKPMVPTSIRGLEISVNISADAATPDAAFIIATSASIPNTDIKEPPSLPALNSKGFNLVASISDDVGQLFYYRSNNNIQDLPKKLTNGTHPQEVHILEPIFVSHQSEIVSKELRDNLVDQGFVVTTSKGLGTIKTNVNDVNKQIYIALLELESPVLEDLSESEFQNIKKLFLSSERLLWITRGDNPSFGIVDGVARCVNNEIASTRFQVLHLSKEGINHGPRLAIRVLKHLEATADNEFRERNGCLQVQRIYKGHNEDEHIRNHLEDSTRVSSINDANALFSLTIGKPGLLDTLHFIREENYLDLPLAKTEIEVEVKATGLNFRDIMASMGLVPVTGLGQEACGIVLRAGTLAAESFKIGDRVSTLSIGGVHATKAICDFRVTAKIPEKLSFEEGAASSMAHITAYYALVKLARLRRGQSVLIHAAAGGVGQAAVQLAKHLGLVVYVTVGSEDKRRFMTEHFGIVPEHIFNSRDSSFAKGIHRVTAGRGVDCVLNSLSGELLRISWNCLATFGTFVEIGLRDITDNMRLDMRPFSKSATFTYLDIPTLIKEDPTAIGEALAEVFKLLQKDILQVPSPLTTYPVGKVEDAFRIMQQGKHRGKIVLTFQEEDKKNARVLCKAKDSLKLDPTGTYLFVGGLGGLGRSLAKEFVASGARNIALISRSGTSKAESKAVVDELIALGVQVKVFRADIANQSSFLSAMEDCSQQLPPVKGVIQMAMILRDGVIENMTYEDWTIPLRTKVQGTWNLHQYFNHDRPLDFMIFCSSISGICGNPGQAQYDAGNSYQDALAHYRHSQGLKAVSVNLGIMLDVGVIAESVTHNFKTWEQVLGIREPTFHALMKTIINSQQNSQGGDWSPQICVGLGTANIMAANNLPNPPWLEDPRFGPLAVSDKTLSSSADSEGSTTISLASKLSDAGNNKDLSLAANIITVALVAKIAEILRIPSSEVDPSRPMYQYGVDSLVALEVRNWITRELKANMALLDIVAATPMETFAAQISQKSKLVMGVS
ncbi:putative Mycocerosic acid synthase [Glarea lozoyensis 74030]|uniref:Putative Mycocerosic acid synthase n=1 Tax=Glarea lozoyensis (strain ATCC 74030 / MF5533) TaxID=1104152 RepID=H0EXX8_GLAL7|nr:putative Mycocerosic acid synthase [Glarea lozoyensis 74030]